MNQPNKFCIKKPRITLNEQQKNQARAGMAGEAVRVTGEEVPKAPEPETAPNPTVSVPEIVPAMPSAPDPSPEAEEIIARPSRQGRGRGRKPEKNPTPVAEDLETQHVRMSKDAVMRAKMNVLLLPSSMGIRSLRDYGDAAFDFFEAHLRKTGKLPNR